MKPETMKHETTVPMFGKVKKWLGIEGVKVELVLPEMAFEEVGAVSGQLVFHSKNIFLTY